MIIIKNFEMPDSCVCCPCSVAMESLAIDNYPYDLCVLTGEEVAFYDCSRYERCPLVEVEEIKCEISDAEWLFQDGCECGINWTIRKALK